MQFSIIRSFGQIEQNQWQKLCIGQSIFLHAHFLQSLEDSQSACEQTGWQPYHLVGYEDGKLVMAMPGYIKSHSYGEYVFDFSWADAYQRYGQRYYPKWIGAIPFTPVSGQRILLAEHVDRALTLKLAMQYIQQHVKEADLSSFHLLFSDQDTSQQLHKQGWIQRLSVQFQWYNRDYKDFSDFTARFTARRRKSVRKEREKIAQQGIHVERLSAQQITQQHMAFFYQCYCATYQKRSGHDGYLTETFFTQLFQHLTDNMLLVIAYRQQQPIASALFLFDQQQLNGRYWGALEHADGLHFECCYYQGIEFCIEQNIQAFNPGTQGEHKILRGFEPVFCYSNHYVADPGFQRAVADFVTRESAHLIEYKHQAASLLPFKQSE